jgi:hypothetical protein
MAKRKPKKDRPTKAMRLAHKILSQTIWPANLQIEDAIEALGLVAKELVLEHTSDDDPEDRSELIDAVENHLGSILADIDPLADRTHLWLVPPQGDITEPFGILWDGGYEEDSVSGVLGAELELLRKQYAEPQDKGVVIIEGVDGVAMIVPDWDGEDTATCEDCDRVHNVHLSVAEGLFHQSVERRQQRLAAN